MIRSKENWRKIHDMLSTIMSKKEQEEYESIILPRPAVFSICVSSTSEDLVLSHEEDSASPPESEDLVLSHEEDG
ncbi:hypothetical protein QE152_g10141 [Popillia japonica]|uniref:Uncharacterized protein n=1 Tax=Popillia japonica TaxID=7064 RepID=A0AAW1LW19_POPJA